MLIPKVHALAHGLDHPERPRRSGALDRRHPDPPRPGLGGRPPHPPPHRVGKIERHLHHPRPSGRDPRLTKLHLHVCHRHQHKRPRHDHDLQRPLHRPCHRFADEAGNVISISRTQFGGSGTSVLLGVAFHNAGRPDQRTVASSGRAMGGSIANYGANRLQFMTSKFGVSGGTY
jgi:hypothetical protein